MSKLRIVLADDHRMFRHALRALLEKESGIEVVAEAADGVELLAILAQQPADVVCMDIGMPAMNGIDATRHVLARWPHLKVIGLSAFLDRQFVIDLLKAGAHGYVSKADASDELLRAIDMVGKGRTYLCPDVAATVASALLHDSRLHAAQPRLTQRERQVLQRIAEGHTSADIAAQLRVAASTVEVHRRNLMRKLGLHSIAELTRYAIRHGISPGEL